VASSVQLAIAFSPRADSPELEEWAAWALIPEDPAALASAIAGFGMVNLLLSSSCRATGQPPAATLQKLAISAAAGQRRPSPDSQRAARGEAAPARTRPHNARHGSSPSQAVMARPCSRLSSGMKPGEKAAPRMNISFLLYVLVDNRPGSGASHATPRSVAHPTASPDREPG
jgi:hypothetical protein